MSISSNVMQCNLPCKAKIVGSFYPFQIYYRTEGQDKIGWFLKHLRVEIPNSQMTYEIPCNVWVTAKEGTQGAYHRLTITPQYLVKKRTGNCP